MSQERDLVVGDKVYASMRDVLTRVYTITRVTNTRAFAQLQGGNEIAFRIKIDTNGYVREIGKDTWSTTYYQIESESLQKKAYFQNLQRRVKNFDYTKCSVEDLEEIYKIITKY